MAIRLPHLAHLVATAIATVSLAPVMPLYAQSPSAPSAPAAPLTLSQAIARALTTAPGLRSAEASVGASEAAVQAARLLPNPTLSVEAENVLGTGRYARFGESETTFSVSMPLELGGKRAARTRVVQAEEATARVGVNAARVDLTLR
ncbi:MAG: TolC family protein, partial [Alphaproteobacteria bacterium]